MFTTAKFDQSFGYYKVILALDHADVRGLGAAIRQYRPKPQISER